jgi:serine phosphatase RsbU (regulator of sigma subunit)/anti-sigma regulatory factor (Ser/Thr protein kinase)
VLFSNRANGVLLSEMLADRYAVLTSIDDLDEADPTGPFDLCVVDFVSLQRLRLQLRGVRERYKPYALPCLVLADRKDQGLQSKALWEVADDVVLRPVDRLELALRVQSLLRQRALTVRLGQLADQYEHERRVATRLQAAAMPQDLALPGVEFNGVYSAGSQDATVGGDWYDALRLPDGRIVLTIGDVAGSGLEAAVTMTTIKQAIRGIAFLHSDPALILDAADRALAVTEPGRVVTAFIGVYDAVSSELRFSGAGHPRPLIRRSTGNVEELKSHGLPLGLPWRLGRTSEKCQLADGDTLILYTDGLIESTRDAIGAENALQHLLTLDAAGTSHNIARHIFDSMLSGQVDDDVAIATMRVNSQAGAISRWTVQTAEPSAVNAARAQLLKAVATHVQSDAAMQIASLILAELIANVVRYAAGEMDLAVDLNGVEPVVHVLDRGAGFHHSPRLPKDYLDVSGRGLFLVASLSSDFNIERRLGGGSHARAVISTTAEISARASSRYVNIDAP